MSLASRGFIPHGRVIWTPGSGDGCINDAYKTRRNKRRGSPDSCLFHRPRRLASRVDRRPLEKNRQNVQKRGGKKRRRNVETLGTRESQLGIRRDRNYEDARVPETGTAPAVAGRTDYRDETPRFEVEISNIVGSRIGRSFSNSVSLFLPFEPLRARRTDHRKISSSTMSSHFVAYYPRDARFSVPRVDPSNLTSKCFHSFP